MVPLRSLLANPWRLVAALTTCSNCGRFCGRTFLQIVVLEVSPVGFLNGRLDPGDHIGEGAHSGGSELVHLCCHLCGGMQMLLYLSSVLAEVTRLCCRRFLQLLLLRIGFYLRSLSCCGSWASGSILLQSLLLLRSVLLVQDILVFTHAFGLINTKLLPLLVPTPLIDLGFGEMGRRSDLLKSLLRPKVVLLEGVRELLQLTLGLAFALADDSDHLSVGFVKHVAAAARDGRN